MIDAEQYGWYNYSGGKMMRLYTSLFSLFLMLSGPVICADAAQRLITVGPDVVFPVHNTRLGSQGFDSWYKLNPNEAWVVQAARYELAMGSDVYKFTLAQNSSSVLGAEAATADVPGVVDLTTRAKLVPAFAQVLDMPFRYTMIWVYPVAMPFYLSDGYSTAEANNEYWEIYDFTRYLMQKYQGTGRVFLLGHWEGDWTLLEGYNYNGTPREAMITAMRSWLANRQAAVEAARLSLPDVNGVAVYNYAEINIVQKVIDDPTKNAVVNAVLPHITVDAVSYSAYDATSYTSQLPQRLYNHLNYIENQAHFSGAWPFGKAVFIGEFGIGNVSGEIPAIKAAGQWGCPFALYWSVFEKDRDSGLVLINSSGNPTSTYNLQQEILGKAIAQRDIARLYLLRNPYETELSSLIGSYNAVTLSNTLKDVINHPEFAARIDKDSYAKAMFEQLLLTRNFTGSLYTNVLSGLANGTRSRWNTLCYVLDSLESKNASDDAHFARWLYEKVLVREPNAITPAELASTQTALSTNSRSSLYAEFLNSTESMQKGLELRYIEMPEELPAAYQTCVTDEVYGRFMPDFRDCPEATKGSFSGDFNGDCYVDFADLMIFSANWLSTIDDNPADLDGSGIVNFVDMSYFAALWFERVN